MAVQSAKAPPGVRGDALPGFAVAAIREDGRWRCAPMDPDALVDLDAAITELRGLRSTGAVLGLLDVDDEFFVLLRPTRSEERRVGQERRAPRARHHARKIEFRFAQGV